MGDLHARLLAHIDEYVRSAFEDSYPVAAPLAALRAVVELHTPEVFGGIWACLACSPGMPPQILRAAPCSTIRVIAEQLGVPIDKSITEESA
jgi:hypothetical protein